MDFWTLLIIAWIDSGQWIMAEESTYKNMDECMARREEVIEEIGRPIKNYQAICIWHEGKDSM